MPLQKIYLVYATPYKGSANLINQIIYKACQNLSIRQNYVESIFDLQLCKFLKKSIGNLRHKTEFKKGAPLAMKHGAR